MAVSLQFFQAGFCQHIEAVCIQGGKWKIKKYPAMVTLIHHPNFGYFLFDTGYSHRFFKETQYFPEKLYAWLTPVSCQPEDTILAQLAKKQIYPDDIKGVILSHFHADHIAGLKDFPTSRLYCLQEGYESLSLNKPWRALLKGILPGLLPDNLSSRLNYIDDLQTKEIQANFSPFDKGYDIFGDSSLVAIPLPGHAKGQIGLLCQTENEKYYFLVADACWDSLAYSALRMPHKIANLITDDVQAYRNTLTKLHNLNKNNPKLTIVPSHCQNTFAALALHQEKTCRH